jgi:hypothetical protein
MSEKNNFFIIIQSKTKKVETILRSRAIVLSRWNWILSVIVALGVKLPFRRRKYILEFPKGAFISLINQVKTKRIETIS